MTRWKRERTEIVREMLDYHRHSRWGWAVIQAAEELCDGLVCGQDQRYRGCDGGTYERRVWLVPAALLERVGGMAAIHERADELVHEALLSAESAARRAAEAAL